MDGPDKGIVFGIITGFGIDGILAFGPSFEAKRRGTGAKKTQKEKQQGINCQKDRQFSLLYVD